VGERLRSAPPRGTITDCYTKCLCCAWRARLTNPTVHTPDWSEAQASLALTAGPGFARPGSEDNRVAAARVLHQMPVLRVARPVGQPYSAHA
jgi:hypothetical protein